jgi:hypothetical protein
MEHKMKRNKKTTWNNQIILSFLLVLGFSLSTFSDENRSSYEVWSDLQESATSYNARGVLVDGEVVPGMETGVTFGAEKEASSGLLTRVMSPDSHLMRSWLEEMSPENQEIFLKDFFTNFVKDRNGHRTYKSKEGKFVDLSQDVADINGVSKTIDMSLFKNVNYDSLSLEQLKEKWGKFLEVTHDRPLNFVNPKVRMKFFKGSLPGIENNSINPRKNVDISSFGSWGALYGKSQKYIDAAHAHGGGARGGWEINFLPQQTYGEFEEMVIWFRKELENAGKLFQAPGHQRMVFARHPQLNEARLAETFRIVQALIVVDGIKGKTGIEKANFKDVQADHNLASLYTDRGVIRLEGDRWGTNTFGIEFRAGTKDIKLARFYQTALSARVATNDFEGLAKISDYNLYKGNWEWDANELKTRFGVDLATAEKAIKNIQDAGVKPSYTLPFWSWEDGPVPFLSKTKQRFIKSLTKDFIEQAAEYSSGVDLEKSVRKLMRSWVKATKLSEELRNYLKPNRNVGETANLLNFELPTGRSYVSNPVDVNKIDLGIEYSGKFPIKLDATYSPERLADNKKAWIETGIDLTPAERKAVIEKVAQDLDRELGGTGVAQEVEEAGGHGHGLEVAYTIRDPQNRKWIVEWDGIGRSYTPEGEIIPDSVRGGSIELVTPKFTPKTSEMEAVYKAFDSNNIMPALNAGGGHINVDLAAFDGNPKALARFMTIFHENRGIIALMFQNINRLKSAEPIDINPDLAAQLKNFNGSEDELKTLLYDKGYFNPRYGRKTRYNQLDVSAYYQDVIPADFITDDFDIASPVVPWRRTFRVNPKIRKAEFRLFNAPRDAMESALQIRLVKGMLSKALNETDSLSGVVQDVDHVDYLNNTDKAYRDIEKLCDQLGLDLSDYRPAVAEGLSDVDLAVRSVFFEPLDQKLLPHPLQVGWGDAVGARAADEALNSEGRLWSVGEVDELNTINQDARVEAAREAQRLREEIIPNRDLPQGFKRRGSCVDAAGAFL